MNIVICCDGTGNEFGVKNSNVIKLFSILEKNQKDQITFYHPGLGTQGITNPFNWFTAKVEKICGLAFGYGIRRDVADCYRFIMDNYIGPEDNIYVFGFSRGSYTARVLCSMLYEFGLLNKGNENLIDYAYKLFNKPTKDKLDLAAEFKRTFSRECKPYFAGLWDTVSSVGWAYDFTSFPYTYHNPDLKIGRHAISIDERRSMFRQNLWAPQVENQSIVQVWFPGCHSDVGGGYKYPQCGLSQTALQWMILEAVQAGLVVDTQKEQQLYQPPNVQPDFKAKIHNSLVSWWLPLEILPKRYFDFKTKTKKWEIPWGKPRFIPEDSLIHRSVEERMEKVPGYNPKNLPDKNKYKVVN